MFDPQKRQFFFFWGIFFLGAWWEGRGEGFFSLVKGRMDGVDGWVGEEEVENGRKGEREVGG